MQTLTEHAFLTKKTATMVAVFLIVSKLLQMQGASGKFFESYFEVR